MVKWCNGMEIINGYTFSWYLSEWCGNWWFYGSMGKQKISGTGVK
jgi:hypothetical protein